MAIPVARVHLAEAHAALPALLPTPPKCEMLPLLPTPCVAAVLPKPLANPSRADSDGRWDARKTIMIKPASTDQSSTPASSSSSSGTSAHVSSGKWTVSRASSSAERWDVHKKHRPPQATELLDDGSNDIDTDQEEIVWKPRAIYAGPGFVSAAPEGSMLPMPTAFLLRVA